jgi:F-type H+-transporting ATPase subunit gamma
MASLRDLRTRIRSVKSTRKITSAMKVVAASKLRWSQEGVEAVRPYENNMHFMVDHLLQGQQGIEQIPLILSGHSDLKVHLLIVVTTDRGLCGGFNSAIAREAKIIIRKLQAEEKEVKILCVGRKGSDLLRHDYQKLYMENNFHTEAQNDHAGGKNRITHSFQDALSFAVGLQKMVESRQFGQASILFTIFHSAISQEIAHHDLIPFPLVPFVPGEGKSSRHALYEYEPHLDSLLKHLLYRYLAIHLYRVFLESHASEQGARMMAMDNATRNATDMIQRLERTYNQTRQAFITKELIEIISAAEAILS